MIRSIGAFLEKLCIPILLKWATLVESHALIDQTPPRIAEGRVIEYKKRAQMQSLLHKWNGTLLKKWKNPSRISTPNEKAWKKKSRKNLGEVFFLLQTPGPPLNSRLLLSDLINHSSQQQSEFNGGRGFCLLIKTPLSKIVIFPAVFWCFFRVCIFFGFLFLSVPFHLWNSVRKFSIIASLKHYVFHGIWISWKFDAPSRKSMVF